MKTWRPNADIRDSGRRATLPGRRPWKADVLPPAVRFDPGLQADQAWKRDADACAKASRSTIIILPRLRMSNGVPESAFDIEEVNMRARLDVAQLATAVSTCQSARSGAAQFPSCRSIRFGTHEEGEIAIGD